MTVSYGYDYEYAHAKLSGSVVRYQEKLVYVYEIPPSGKAIVKPILENDNLSVHINSLDLTPVPLGYMNYGTSAHYISRIPRRNWKQGIRPESICSDSAYTQSFTLECEEFINTVDGKYPALEMCAERIVCKEVTKQAFSRFFALGEYFDGVFLLWYKNLIVGGVSPDKHEMFLLIDDYKYLHELIEETVYDKISFTDPS